MKTKMIAVTLSLGVAAATMAYADVSNPAVAARMEAMKDIGGSMKTLGDMAKGSVDFDAEAAQAALATVAESAAVLPALFEAQESDPESEAKPEIWTNWDDFVSKAEALEAAAAGATIASSDDIGPAMGALGGSCKSCHSEYRM